MRLIGVLLVAGAVGVACSEATGGGGGGRSTTITVGNNFFSPTPDTVSPGTVTFQWSSGGVAHNVTWVAGPTSPADSDPVKTSGTHQVDVVLGTYDYHCSLHAGMNGRIVVE